MKNNKRKTFSWFVFIPLLIIMILGGLCFGHHHTVGFKMVLLLTAGEILIFLIGILINKILLDFVLKLD